MSDASAAVQVAWYNLLSSALSPTPVFDHVPQDSVALFVTVGDDSANPSTTKSKNSSEHLLEANVYSSKRGFKETKETLRAIYLAAHKRPLAVSGFEATTPLFEFSETFREPDDEGVRGVIRFRTQTQS